MFKRDIIMRQIEQFLGVLLKKKEEVKSNAEPDGLDGEIHRATGIPASLIDRMSDEALLKILTPSGGPDIARLAMLAIGLAARSKHDLPRAHFFYDQVREHVPMLERQKVAALFPSLEPEF